MYCTNCGEQSDGGNFCASCGTELKTSSNKRVEPKSSSPKSSGKLTGGVIDSKVEESQHSTGVKRIEVLIGAGLLLLVGLIIALIAMGNQNESNRQDQVKAGASASAQQSAQQELQRKLSERKAQNTAACEAVNAIDITNRIKEVSNDSDIETKVSTVIGIAEEIRSVSNQGPDVRDSGSDLADSYSALASAIQNQINNPAELLSLIQKAHLNFKNLCDVQTQ